MLCAFLFGFVRFCVSLHCVGFALLCVSFAVSVGVLFCLVFALYSLRFGFALLLAQHVPPWSIPWWITSRCLALIRTQRLLRFTLLPFPVYSRAAWLSLSHTAPTRAPSSPGAIPSSDWGHDQSRGSTMTSLSMDPSENIPKPKKRYLLAPRKNRCGDGMTVQV